MANQTLYPQADSWYLGANIPGKPRVFMPYVGGNAIYQTEIDKVTDQGYAGFDLSSSPSEGWSASQEREDPAA